MCARELDVATEPKLGLPRGTANHDYQCAEATATVLTHGPADRDPCSLPARC